MAKKKTVFVKAKRKRATARATIREGKGSVRINSKPLQVYENPYVQTLIAEPLILAPDYANQYDVEVNVVGGGFMGQAAAARGAIAKALVAITKDEKLKKRFLEYDRSMLVDDSRQVEPKKPLGRGARSVKQSSKR